MKRIFLLLAFPMLLFVSCAKETPAALEEHVEFVAKIDEPYVDFAEGTKTSISGDDAIGYRVLWAAGDKIKVNGTDLALRSTAAGQEIGEFTSIDTVEPDKDGNYIAYYPFTIVNNNYKLASTIYYSDGNIKNFPMYAKSDSKELSFKNLCGIIRLGVTNSSQTDDLVISRIDLNSAQPMSGTFVVEQVADGFAPVITGSNGGVTMADNTNYNLQTIEPGGKAYFLFPAPANDYKQFTISIYEGGSASKILYLKDGDALHVERNRITPVDINVAPNLASVNSLSYKSTDGAILEKYPEGSKFPVSTQNTETSPAQYITVITHIYNPDTQTGMMTFDGDLIGIGFNAFTDCTSLTGITLGPKIKQIGVSAFEGCTNLTSVKIPSVSGVTATTSLGNYAFRNCSSLSSITLPARITTLPAGVFAGCTSLKSINLPESLTTLNTGIFEGCTGLESIVLPSGVTKLAGNGCFEDCVNLKSIILSENLANTIPAYTFKNCRSLTEIIIPDGVTGISSSAPFDACTNLKNIVLPKGLETLPPNLCKGLESLETITLPAALTALPNNLFYGCTSLKSIDIPTGVTSVGTSVFYGCSSLKKIVFPDNIESLTANVLQGCNALESVTFPAELTGVPAACFKPNNTTGSFDNLSEVIFKGNKVATIGKEAFRGCIGLESISIPESVTEFGTYAFYGCTSLKSVNIPGGLTVIPECAFQGCNALSEVTIPEKVERIDKQAFYLTSITDVRIPASVTSLGDKAFYINSDVYSIHISRFDESSQDPITALAAATAFYNAKVTRIYVPAAAVGTYKGADFWKTYETKITAEN